MAAITAVDVTSLLLVEGTTPSTPAATKQRLFIRSSDHQLALVNSSGAVTPIIPAGAMSLIGSSVLGSDTASFSFTSIAATYNHLKLIVMGRLDTAASEDDFCYLKLNNDGGTKYARELLSASTTNIAAAASGSPSAPGTASFLSYLPAASATAGRIGLIEILIPCYALTTFHKSYRSSGGYVDNASASNDRYNDVVGTFADTAAISQVDIIGNGTAKFKTGSAAYLYGLT